VRDSSGPIVHNTHLSFRLPWDISGAEAEMTFRSLAPGLSGEDDSGDLGVDGLVLEATTPHPNSSSSVRVLVAAALGGVLLVRLPAPFLALAIFSSIESSLVTHFQSEMSLGACFLLACLGTDGVRGLPVESTPGRLTDRLPMRAAWAPAPPPTPNSSLSSSGSSSPLPTSSSLFVEARRGAILLRSSDPTLLSLPLDDLDRCGLDEEEGEQSGEEGYWPGGEEERCGEEGEEGAEVSLLSLSFFVGGMRGRLALGLAGVPAS